MSQQPPDNPPPLGWQPPQSPQQYPQGFLPPQAGQWQQPPASYQRPPFPAQPPRNDKLGPLPLWAWGVITFVGVIVVAAIAGTLSNPSSTPQVIAAVTPITLVGGGQAVTATSIPTVTPVPSATPVPIVSTTEWAVVKSTGAEVKAGPDSGATTLEKLGSFTVVAMQRKLQSGAWYERAGGGWLARNDLTIYGNEAEARRAAPQPTQTPTPVPTYNPNQLPTAVPAVVPQQLAATATPPAAAIPAAKPAATSKPAATTPNTPTSAPAPAQIPPKTRGTTDASSPCLEGQIKGNRNSGIYHVPSGRDYAKTKANVQCFDTAAQAEAAGFRASKV